VYSSPAAAANDDADQLRLWEPKIDILDANEIKRVQKLEERKNRYIKRMR
jgi:hypothetical protein